MNIPKAKLFHVSKTLFRTKTKFFFFSFCNFLPEIYFTYMRLKTRSVLLNRQLIHFVPMADRYLICLEHRIPYAQSLNSTSIILILNALFICCLYGCKENDFLEATFVMKPMVTPYKIIYILKRNFFIWLEMEILSCNRYEQQQLMGQLETCQIKLKKFIRILHSFFHATPQSNK